MSDEMQGLRNIAGSVTTIPLGATKPHRPRSKAQRELALLRRDGLIRYTRSLYCLWRFHRSVRRMMAAEPYDY